MQPAAHHLLTVSVASRNDCRAFTGEQTLYVEYAVSDDKWWQRGHWEGIYEVTWNDWPVPAVCRGHRVDDNFGTAVIPDMDCGSCDQNGCYFDSNFQACKRDGQNPGGNMTQW